MPGGMSCPIKNMKNSPWEECEKCFYHCKVYSVKCVYPKACAVNLGEKCEPDRYGFHYCPWEKREGF